MKADAPFRYMKQKNLSYFFGKVNNSTDIDVDVFQKIGGTGMVKPLDMSKTNKLAAKY